LAKHKRDLNRSENNNSLLCEGENTQVREEELGNLPRSSVNKSIVGVMTHYKGMDFNLTTFKKEKGRALIFALHVMHLMHYTTCSQISIHGMHCSFWSANIYSQKEKES